jgi:ADP-L-glycero-D-manno-heptose 6-epimerase
MQQQDMIVITGAAGFIGSFLVGYLNRQGFTNLVLVDDFDVPSKQMNLAEKDFAMQIHREKFFEWCHANPGIIKHILHLGARTDTTEMDYEVHKKWNLDYSKEVWKICVSQGIPLVYASSAATYGNGEHGYNDDHTVVDQLTPLNPYGLSKQEFDQWALQQASAPPFWAGVKFFNVYGPNEYHKGRMASVIFHSFYQVRDKGSVRLFRSHNPAYTDGGQMRDFVYVKDVVSMCTWLMTHQPESGLYNIGSGQARTFIDLVNAIFDTLNIDPQIDFIDTPEDIRDKYQYFTEANMAKIRHAGYDLPSYSLEAGVRDYITEYLQDSRYY